MELKIYSIRDSKGEFYHPPFYSRTHAEAERNFAQLTSDDKSMISKYPQDFDLYYLGTFDQNLGKIVSLDTPHHIVKAVNIPSRQDGSQLNA